MAHVRRVLAPLTATWLFCQIGTVALVPVALWLSAADPHAVECTCGHGVGAMCPMHHQPAGRKTPCAMQAANSSESAFLTTLAAVAGLVPELTMSIGPANVAGRVGSADVQVTSRRPIPPDPPPPRA